MDNSQLGATPQTATLDQIKLWLNEVEADNAPENTFIPEWLTTKDNLKVALRPYLPETADVDKVMSSLDMAINLIVKMLGDEAFNDSNLVLSRRRAGKRRVWWVSLTPWNNTDEAYWSRVGDQRTASSVFSVAPRQTGYERFRLVRLSS